MRGVGNNFVINQPIVSNIVASDACGYGFSVSGEAVSGWGVSGSLGWGCS